eukprot:TRINITY_DN2998_c1_g2_i1.p5 TRINITY_DN2998_c1_g2~~TRINITY_DN2998_c1_g2_i1.p5  ORF type:complete len:103 (+),score=50.35 TRINITY_DN2998_c1_g2_i1:1828-2136(+)
MCIPHPCEAALLDVISETYRLFVKEHLSLKWIPFFVEFRKNSATKTPRLARECQENGHFILSFFSLFFSTFFSFSKPEDEKKKTTKSSSTFFFFFFFSALFF